MSRGLGDEYKRQKLEKEKLAKAKTKDEEGDSSKVESEGNEAKS